MNNSQKMKAQNGESEGEELSESDDRSILVGGANEFSSPSEPFGTFTLKGYLVSYEKYRRESRA
jgi:hypothetical protein